MSGCQTRVKSLGRKKKEDESEGAINLLLYLPRYLSESSKSSLPLCYLSLHSSIPLTPR